MVSYKEFNNLFWIKKHELDRSQLCMFGANYIESLQLLMPTMCINKGDNEDSDYEEQLLISSKQIIILECQRRLITSKID